MDVGTNLIRVFSGVCTGLLLVFFVLYPVPAQATSNSLSLSAGYRIDNLDWNIASDFSGSTPNILSELSWDDLQIFQLSAESVIVRPLRDRRSAVLIGRASYGWIVAGDNQDSDYAGDNRTLEWSRSNNDAGDGHVFDLEGGVGIKFDMQNSPWALTPLIGYSYYEQDMVMQDGYQTLSVPALAPPPIIPSPVGPIPGLDSSYLAWWFGPWFGLQVDYQQTEKLQWDCSLRWHKVDFRAEADWNLRTDLQHPVSFEHQADGDGFSLSVGGQYAFDEKWNVTVDLSMYDLQADDGIDIVYFESGTVGGTRLNAVNWESLALSFAAQYHF